MADGSASACDDSVSVNVWRAYATIKKGELTGDDLY